MLFKCLDYLNIYIGKELVELRIVIVRIQYVLDEGSNPDERKFYGNLY